MPFTEPIKQDVRRKALYKCVICHEPFVEVHHIVPESEGGPNTIDNAAPLCAGCHDAFGNNPDKRKQIAGMRDLWYELCEKRYGEKNIDSYEKLHELHETMKTVQADQIKYGEEILGEIKATMSGILTGADGSIKRAETVKDVIAISGDVTSGFVTGATRLGENVYANVHCPNCNSYIGLLVGSDRCPSCRTPIR